MNNSVYKTKIRNSVFNTADIDKHEFEQFEYAFINIYIIYLIYSNIGINGVMPTPAAMKTNISWFLKSSKELGKGPSIPNSR